MKNLVYTVLGILMIAGLIYYPYKIYVYFTDNKVYDKNQLDYILDNKLFVDTRYEITRFTTIEETDSTTTYDALIELMAENNPVEKNMTLKVRTRGSNFYELVDNETTQKWTWD